MAISATFKADFTDFEAAVRRADAQLIGLSEAARKVGPDIDRMVGKGPKDLDRLNDSARQGANYLKALHGSVDQVDRVLAAAGQSLGPIPGALKELGTVAGQTAADLGLLATGGLTVAAALGGWQVGRAIAEFTGSDKIIGGATAALLGWGTAAKEEAAAGAQTLAIASERANRTITDLSEAIQINLKWTADWALHAGRARDAAGESAAQVAKWHAEIAQVASDGNLESLNKDLASQNFTLQELSKRYGIHIEALQLLTRETKAAADAEEHLRDVRENNAAKLAQLAEDIQKDNEKRAQFEQRTTNELIKLQEMYYTQRVQMSGTTNEIEIANIKRWAKVTEEQLRTAGITSQEVYAQIAANADQAIKAVGIDWDFLESRSIEALQETLKNATATYAEMVTGSRHYTRDALDEQIKKIHDAEDALRGMGKAAAEEQEKAAEATRAATEELKKQTDAARQRTAITFGGAFEVTRENFESTARGLGGDPGAIERLLKKGYSFQQALLWSKHPDWPPPEHPGPRVPGFASGVKNFGGGLAVVGERGPELVRLPAGSDVLPMTGAGAAKGVVVNIQPGAFVWPVMNDRTSIEMLARQIGRAIVADSAIVGRRT